RIFTPAAEIPFAGHPTVGTAVLLNRIDGTSGARDIVVEEGVGPVRCTVETLDPETGSARFTLPRLPEPSGNAGPPAAVAAALSINESDLGFDGYKPGRWSAGAEYPFVPLSGLDAIRRCRINSAHWRAAFGNGRASDAYMFCRETVEPGHAFHVRMFAPEMGIPEDPATGGGAAAFAGLVARGEGLADGEHAFALEQGYEMGRPSLIRLSMTIAGGKLIAGTIAGEAVVVSEGTLVS